MFFCKRFVSFFKRLFFFEWVCVFLFVRGFVFFLQGILCFFARDFVFVFCKRFCVLLQVIFQFFCF